MSNQFRSRVLNETPGRGPTRRALDVDALRRRGELDIEDDLRRQEPAACVALCEAWLCAQRTMHAVHG